MKHAFLIIAHSDFQLVKKLIEELDDARNDIFVHIDAKAPFDGTSLHCRRSSLHVVETRIDAAWADYSLVEIELLLLRTATSARQYAYYHLISGADVPIKSQDYIHEFCETNQGKEFIAFSEISEKDLRWRANHHFCFRRDFRRKNFLLRVIRGLQVRWQDFFCRINRGIDFYKGSQWFSITDDFARYLLQKETYIRQVFQKTFAPDEMVVQTMVMMSPFKDNIYDSRLSACGNMRFIKWKAKEPVPIEKSWAEEMVSSQHWFARKCNNVEVASAISDYLKER